jgi:Uma2 family endonuclease
LAALVVFAESRRLGVVWDFSTGFRMNNLNIRAPDISFISYTRLNALGFDVSSRGFIPVAPDLAVEVLSLDNTRKDINDRLKDFFNSGTRLAWIIDPKAKLAEVCHSPTERRRVVRADILDGEDVLPGFRYPVGDLFLVWQGA